MSLRAWYAAALLAAAGMLPASLASQLDSAATIRGTASSTFNGHPLAGVMVSVPAVHRFAVSDSDGRFELAGLPPGRQRIRVNYEGRNTEEYDFDLRRGQGEKVGVVVGFVDGGLPPVRRGGRGRRFFRDPAGVVQSPKWGGGVG